MLRRFLRNTALGRLAMIPIRFTRIAGPHLARQAWAAVRWSFASREFYNHSYELTPRSRQYLAWQCAQIAGVTPDLIDAYFDELTHNEALHSRLQERWRLGPDRYSSDRWPRYGRRLAWYALVRALKPSVMVETGIDRG